MLEKLDVTRKSVKSEYIIETYTKETQNGFKDLNLRPETIKFLEENIARTLFNITHSNMFLNLPPKTKEKKAKEFQKNIYFCFMDYAKAFHCVNHKKLWRTLKVMGILDHLTCV